MTTFQNDSYAGRVGDLDSPATRLFAVTPDDTTLLAESTRAVYVGGAGNISVLPVGQGTSVTLTGVQGGTILPIRVARVNATGTTATAIVGLA